MIFDFGNKKQYRRTIWRTFRDACVGRLREARGLLMPALEGDEIDVAIQNGFREENLSICDRKPAYVATLKRRYPRLTTFGVEVDRAIARQAKKKGTWDVANLDFTSCMGRPMAGNVLAFARSGVMPYGLVAISMLRGREQPEWFKKILGFAAIKDETAWEMDFYQTNHESDNGACKRLELSDETDKGRIGLLSFLLRGGGFKEDPWQRTNMVYLSRFGSYASTAGTQTMLWAVFRLHRMPCLCNLCIGTCVFHLQDRKEYPNTEVGWTPSSTLAWLGLEWKRGEQELRDIWEARAKQWPRDHTASIYWNEVTFWTQHFLRRRKDEPWA